jgi:hypothetical protein
MDGSEALNVLTVQPTNRLLFDGEKDQRVVQFEVCVGGEKNTKKRVTPGLLGWIKGDRLAVEDTDKERENKRTTNFKQGEKRKPVVEGGGGRGAPPFNLFRNLGAGNLSDIRLIYRIIYIAAL